MLLGAIILKNVQNVNSYQKANQVTLRQGNAATVYFQLVDLEQLDKNEEPLRYIPVSGASLTASIGSINASYSISKAATQPYSSDDRSIWALSILSTETPTAGNLNITLTENSTVRTTSVANAIVVWSTNPSYC